jgi:hypothetical protein
MKKLLGIKITLNAQQNLQAAQRPLGATSHSQNVVDNLNN